jgi:3-hydroxyacyl-CoA dehydrogenase/enoyl-CoA hydratase/3-hydroxybutyryl-CoA epimerase
MSAFTFERRGSVAVVTFDTPHDAVNKISKAIGWELEDLMQRLQADEVVKSIVIRSGKPDIFIAGADIEEFVALRSVEEANRLAKDGQLLMQRIADSTKPVVAAIHGACLGGGLELALACSYRVASDHPKTVLGFPEVQLGVIPAAGGSTRLPRLIGAHAALDMILTGRHERGKKALAVGLIDELVPEPILLDIAVAAAERLSRGGKTSARRGGSFLLDGNPIGRLLVPTGISQGEGAGRRQDRWSLPGTDARHRRAAHRPRARDGARPRGRSTGLWRAGHDRCVAPAGRDFFRHERTQEG